MSPIVPKEWIRNASDELAIAEGCYFDAGAGEFVCDFIETFCKQSKGEWGGTLVELLQWEVDFIMRLFGWKMPSGLRRFRTAYLEVAKKNGKSTLISCLAVEHIIGEGEPGAECYINACDRSQASIVHDEAERMVRASEAFSARLECVPSKKRIVDPINNSVIVANSADVPSKDGLNASMVIFDELHRQRDDRLWKVMKFAGSSRRQPLNIAITTAGESKRGIWFEQRDFSEKVNAGIVKNTRHLGVVYRADETDDIDDPATWRKANPSLGVTISEEDFRADLAEAKEKPSMMADFLRLRLNIVTSSATRFVSLKTWERCGGPIDIDSLRGQACWGGLDLASTTDLASFTLIFGDSVDGFDVLSWSWIPDEPAHERETINRISFSAWERAGYLTMTPGNVIDYAFIRRTIVELSEMYDFKAIFADPYNARQLLGQLADEDGLPVKELRQGFLSLSSPTKELERLLLSRKLRHGDNPVLSWAADNAVTVKDAAGNIKLSKEKSTEKIDPMAALVNAVAAATEGAGEDDSVSVYESRGMIFL